MRIGVLSDTHGDVLATQRAARMFQSFRIDGFLHCGDIGTPEVVRQLSAGEGHFVLGNMDKESGILREAVLAAGFQFHDRFAELEFHGQLVAVVHGDDPRQLQQAVESGRYDLVCHGHTHVAHSYRSKRTLVVNPGAVHRADNASVAIVDLPAMEVIPVIL